jgi:hypothetical protein
MIPKTQLERRVLAVFREQVLVQDVLQDVYEKAKLLQQNGDGLRNVKRVSLKQSISTNAKSIDSIVRAIRDAGHSAALLAELASLEGEQREAQERLAQLEAQPDTALPDIDIADYIANMNAALDRAEPGELTEIVRGAVASVTATKQGRQVLTGEITFRFPVGEDIITVVL